MTTLSLELSKKIFELIGKYETEKYYNHILQEEQADEWMLNFNHGSGIPSPNFAEVCRIFPKISKAKHWEEDCVERPYINFIWAIEDYINAPTEEVGMQKVESYLNSILDNKSSDKSRARSTKYAQKRG